MLDDSLLIQVRDGAMQAKAAIEAQAEYHRWVDGTNDADEAWYDAQMARYDQLIDAINLMFQPVE